MFHRRFASATQIWRRTFDQYKISNKKTELNYTRILEWLELSFPFLWTRTRFNFHRRAATKCITYVHGISQVNLIACHLMSFSATENIPQDKCRSMIWCLQPLVSSPVKFSLSAGKFETSDWPGDWNSKSSEMNWWWKYRVHKWILWLYFKEIYIYKNAKCCMLCMEAQS